MNAHIRAEEHFENFAPSGQNSVLWSLTQEPTPP
jgi:hypothetical protein